MAYATAVSTTPGPFSVTANSRLPTVSSTPSSLATLTIGMKPVSSIIPVAVPSTTSTSTGFDSVTVNVSSDSATPSSTIGIEIAPSVSPGARVSVPVVVL